MYYEENIPKCVCGSCRGRKNKIKIRIIIIFGSPLLQVGGLRDDGVTTLRINNITS